MPVAVLAVLVVIVGFIAYRFSGLAEAMGSNGESAPSESHGSGELWPSTIWGDPAEDPGVEDTSPPTTEVTQSQSSWFDMGSLFNWTAKTTETPSVNSDSLIGSGLPDWEQTIIVDTAKKFGIDARLLAALRKAENGGPGREFGVLSVSAPTYQEQATVAARTISNNLSRYRATGLDPIDSSGRVTRAFINYFSNIYAPKGASNDPTNLNQYHANNIAGFYGNINFA